MRGERLVMLAFVVLVAVMAVAMIAGMLYGIGMSQQIGGTL
jgi:hypothetical protein